MRVDAISIGIDPPHEVNVVIEVPVGGEPIKYELDKEAGTLVVDRFLYTAMRYPGNYGFIPHTLSGEGDQVRDGQGSGYAGGRPLPLYGDALPRQLRLHPAHAFRRWRPLRRAGRQHT